MALNLFLAILLAEFAQDGQLKPGGGGEGGGEEGGGEEGGGEEGGNEGGEKEDAEHLLEVSQ